jgi:hypothetical protein
VMWFTGASERMVAAWVDAETLTAAVVSSASVSVTRWEGSSAEYLQADETTFSVSPHSFTMTADGDSWVYTISVPVNARGYNIAWEAVPSPADLGNVGQFHFVGPIRDHDEVQWTTTIDPVAPTTPVTTSHRHLTDTDITNSLFINQYRRDPAESTRNFSSTVGYSRGVSGGNNLHITGAKEADKDVLVTWRGVTYTVTDNPGNFNATSVAGTTWEFRGDPGTETAGETFEIQQAGNLTQTVTVIVDRTAPVITTWLLGDFQAGKGTGQHHGATVGDPAIRGEYVRMDYAFSDSNSGIDSRSVSEPDGDVINSMSINNDSGTTGWNRLTSGAPTSGSRRARVTVTDKAGNSSTADEDIFLTGLPTSPTYASTVVLLSNEYPATLHTTDHSATPYDDNSVSATATTTFAVDECRNSATDNTAMQLLSGTLSISTGTDNDIDGETVWTITTGVSNQSSSLSRTIKFRLTDQHYRTVESATFGDYSYNAQKSNDLTSDFTAVGFGDLGLNNSGAETLLDAVAAPRTSSDARISGGGIISITASSIVDGFVKPTTSSAVIEVRVPLAVNNAANNQYAIRMQGAAGQVGELAGLSVEWSPSGAGSWTSATTGTTFTGPTGAAELDVRVSWSATSPDIEAIVVGYVE